MSLDKYLPSSSCMWDWLSVYSRSRSKPTSETYVLVTALPLISVIHLDKLFSLPGPDFPHCGSQIWKFCLWLPVLMFCDSDLLSDLGQDLSPFLDLIFLICKMGGRARFSLRSTKPVWWTPRPCLPQPRVPSHPSSTLWLPLHFSSRCNIL